MTWHVARSLNVLLEQVNERYPNRSKVSDGSIGDAAHASRDSDHNPWYNNTVTARDFTHDPDGGLPCGWLADVLVRHNDPRIKYIIWNRRIWTPGVGWRDYTGSNPHTKHLHLSVDASPICESAARWNLTTATPKPPVEDDMTVDEFLSAKVGKDANTEFNEYQDNPGTVGHYFLAQRQRLDEVEPLLRELVSKVDALKAYVEGLQ
jgi:hypothetical protein